MVLIQLDALVLENIRKKFPHLKFDKWSTKRSDVYSVVFKPTVFLRKEKNLINTFNTIFKIDLDQLTELSRQLLFDVHLSTVINWCYSQTQPNEEYVIQYIQNLRNHKSGGMKFYWSHLDHSNCQYNKSRTKMHNINQLLIQYGIENPNCELYADLVDTRYDKDDFNNYYICGHTYHPLIAMAKDEECLFDRMYDGFNIEYLYNKFNMYIQIGCSPHYADTTCTWYNSGTFVARMLDYIKPDHYNLDEIKIASMDVVLVTNDIDAASIIKTKEKNLAVLRLLIHIYTTYKTMNYHIPEMHNWINAQNFTILAESEK